MPIAALLYAWILYKTIKVKKKIIFAIFYDDNVLMATPSNKLAFLNMNKQLKRVKNRKTNFNRCIQIWNIVSNNKRLWNLCALTCWCGWSWSTGIAASLRAYVIDVEILRFIYNIYVIRNGWLANASTAHIISQSTAIIFITFRFWID